MKFSQVVCLLKEFIARHTTGGIVVLRVKVVELCHADPFELLDERCNVRMKMFNNFILNICIFLIAKFTFIGKMSRYKEVKGSRCSRALV